MPGHTAMPIRSDLKHLYAGADWAARRARVLDRAGDCCERCGKPDREIVYTYTWQSWRFLDGHCEKIYHMAWIPEDGRHWCDEMGELLKQCIWPSRGLPRRIRVCITVAHLDHDPANMNEDNLAALCQWHHLIHDRFQHADSRAGRRDRSRPLLEVSQ